MPGHVAADLDEIGFAHRRIMDEPAVEHDDDAVGNLQDLVEIAAHQQHRGAAIACGDKLGVNLRHSGEIETEAGVGGDHHLDGLAELAREHGPAAAFLRYAPGARVPPHLHAGYEHVLILEGSQTDRTGRQGAGTVIINPPGTRHEVVSEEGCLALLIWERPVIFD